MENKLKIFKKLAVNESFIKPAQNLFLLQPVISKTIKDHWNIHTNLVNVKSSGLMNTDRFYKVFLMKISLLITTFFISIQGYTQDTDSLNVSDNHSPINYYSQLSLGLTSPIYRDFATSPLFYRGVGINLGSAWLKHSDTRERKFKIGVGLNAMSALVPESDFINLGGSVTLVNLNLYYQRLWKLESLSNSKNNVKVGGAVITSQNIRINPSLNNNALGLENISNVMASGQLTRDISRKEPKQLNLLIFKPILKPVKRDFKFQLNAGILNFNYRPGYAYSYDSEMIGLETNPLSWAFSNYKWSMNGWRLNTQIEYIEYLPNGNARSWAYIWDAAHAPGKFEAFQMASHRIQYTLYFHNKKR